MTTIVNTPPANDNSSNNVGMIVGFVGLILVVYLVFVYGIPAIQRVGSGTPQINVPSQVDVNINQPK
jgi:hypothetical protein